MIVVNGLDATSGEYLLPPLSEIDVSRALLEATTDASTAASLRERHRRRTEDHLAPRFGIDETDLSQAGWGIVLSAHADPGLLSALRPLLDLRRAQASTVSERYFREFTGSAGYRPGESKDDFLIRHGAGPGPVRPEALPYFLLLVGGPEQIPFEFQYQLGVQHAVGRLSFDDLDQYALYAGNVVACAARSSTDRPVRFSVFAPRADDDPPTQLSSELLALPLAESLDESGWAVTRLVGDGAHKEGLLDHLAGPDRPDILLTASHGIGFPRGHPQQREGQGALLCQDWAGPGSGPLDPGQYLAGADLAAMGDLDLTGMVAVCFACFSAGTPRYDGFARPGSGHVELAVEPFTAALPRAMLGREHGALAVVGHVDRAWSYSFSWPGAGAQTEVFRSLLGRVGDGAPLGAAMSYLTDRYAELATELTSAVEQVRLGRRVHNEQLAGMWTAYADARDFVVIGDPAVSLARTPEVPVSSSASRRTTDQVSVRSAEPPVDRDASRMPGRQPAPRAPARPDGPPIVVATYVTHDMAQVSVDPETGRIAGAELAFLSRVDLDGNASHVVAEGAPASEREPATDPAVGEIHARLLAVSVDARRAWLRRRDEEG